MAYRYGDRRQMELFPASIESYVAEDDPVRAYDAFIDCLDFEKLGIELDPHKVGNMQYDPITMLKLLAYGYSYGWQTSRKLEKATYHNVSFMWLMGGLKPDHKTIAEFRRNNSKALKKVLKQSARICLKLDLIDGNVLFVDGTKIRANAGRSNNHSYSWYQEQEKKLEERIDSLLKKCEAADVAEQGLGSYIKMPKELADATKLKEKVAAAIKDFQEKGQKTRNGRERTINTTDPESALMKSVQGSHASYNVQNVVDDKHGLIVHADAVSDTNDLNQFAHQIEQAQANLGSKCSAACADAGYADTEELEKVESKEVMVVVPSQRQASHHEEKPFSKSAFTYNKEENCYYCPAQQKLRYVGTTDGGKKLQYQIKKAKTCKQCKHYGVCTKAKKGRKIVRLVNEESKERFEQVYETPEAQAIYKRRKTRAEHPFGHIKHNLGMKNFLLRGREKVQAETSIASTCFNVARMITLLGGVQSMIAKLASLNG